jgi:hypothetical protein
VLRAAAASLGLPPPPPFFPVQDGPGLLQPAAAAAAVGLVPAGIPAPGGVGLAAAARGSAAPTTTRLFEEDPNLLAIVNLMRSAPPKLPMDAEGGRFAVNTDGNILVVLKAREGKVFMKEKPEEDARWLEVTGFQGSLGNSAAGRKAKALFDSLLRSVRFLERF